MTDFQSAHPRVTAQAVAGSPPAVSPVAPLPASPAGGARLGLDRPRGHADRKAVMSA
jgi:hypothetical protein